MIGGSRPNDDIFDPHRNGEKWNRLRTVLQKPMMHPQAATAYLGPQNSVADDFIASLPQHLDANKELNDLSAHLLNYAIEGKVDTFWFDN